MLKLNRTFSRLILSHHRHPQHHHVWYVRPFSSSSSSYERPLIINGRPYQFPLPLSVGGPLVVLLIDGGSVDYLNAASSAGCMPRLNSLLGRLSKSVEEIANDERDAKRFSRSSRKHTSYYSLASSSPSSSVSFGLCSSVVPSFTNPNNVAVICGVGASTTGICGNYFFDHQTKEDVPMNRKEFIRCETIFEALHRHRRANITILTAKQKLLPLLTKGLEIAIEIELNERECSLGTCRALSVEEMNWRHHPSSTISQPPSFTPTALLDSAITFAESHLPQYATIPNIYNPRHSSYLLELGLAIVKQDMRQFRSQIACSSIYYFSTTDYLQHKYEPGHPLCNEYYSVIDRVIGELHDEGCIVGVTADHGMEDKITYSGHPKVVYLLDSLVEAKCIDEDDILRGNVRCILPITDAHLVHHGGLGGFAHLYVNFDRDNDVRVRDIMATLRNLSGVYTVMNRESAAKAFDLPEDRIGDIIIVGDRQTAVGSRESVHVEALKGIGRLRTHGGIEEATVPIFLNRPLVGERKKKLMTGKARNYDLLDFMMNGRDASG